MPARCRRPTQRRLLRRLSVRLRCSAARCCPTDCPRRLWRARVGSRAFERAAAGGGTLRRRRGAALRCKKHSRRQLSRVEPGAAWERALEQLPPVVLVGGQGLLPQTMPNMGDLQGGHCGLAKCPLTIILQLWYSVLTKAVAAAVITVRTGLLPVAYRLTPNRPVLPHWAVLFCLGADRQARYGNAADRCDITGSMWLPCPRRSCAQLCPKRRGVARPCIRKPLGSSPVQPVPGTTVNREQSPVYK